MTAVAFSLDGSVSSDALFRTWGSTIATQLAAVGLVQTSDTGQINWSTVTRGGANTDAGYEVWRFNDAMQGTYPVFVKLYYGQGANSQGARIRIEVGTGSNGSGTLTGTGSGTVYTNAMGGSAGPTGITSWMVSDGSGFAFAHQPETSTAAARGLFAVDRFRNASGTAQSNGFGLVYAGASGFGASAGGVLSVDTANSVVDSRTAMPAILPGNTTLDATGRTSMLANELFFFPTHFNSAGGIHYSKMVSWFWGRDAGVSALLDTDDFLGATRTLRTLGANYFPVAGPAGGSYFAPATWWED